MRQFCKNVFISLLFLSLLTPLLYWQKLLFPFVTTKAFFFRAIVELALPFYFYLLATNKSCRPSLKNPISLGVLLFLLANVISGVFGFNPQRSMWGDFERMGGSFYLAHLSLFYFYVLALVRLDGRIFKYFLQTVVAVGFAAIILGLLGHIGAIEIFKRSGGSRAASAFGNPIFFASFLILPMFVSAWLGLISQSRQGKIWYFSVSALSLFSIYLSGTRGAFVGLIGGAFAGALAYALLSKNKKFKIAAATVLAVIVFLAVFLGVSSFKNPGILQQRSILNLNDSNAQSRFLLWKMAWQGFKEKPLLGSGPENYYIFSNKYYEPKIYSLDPSWFDKPHNYLLEILSTTGLAGALSYVFLALAAIWAMWRAYKAEVLTALEASVLFAGFSAYQIQNLFVFDTVSSSVMFFGFLGFLSFLLPWKDSVLALQKKNTPAPEPGIILPVFGVVLLACLYLFYAATYIGMEINWRVHYGQALTSVNYKQAKQYFDEVKDLPFNFYENEWSHFQTIFSLSMFPLKNQAGFPSKEEAGKILDDTIVLMQDAEKKNPTEPIVFLDLANLYHTKSRNYEPEAQAKSYEYTHKALALAPRRFDVRGFLALMYIGEDKLAEAEKVYIDMQQDYPNEPELKWHLSSVYYFEGKKDQALELGSKILREGFLPKPLAKIDWLADEYSQRNQVKEFLEILKLAAEKNPGNKDVFLKLAAIYNQLGDRAGYEDAISKAREIEDKEKH